MPFTGEASDLSDFNYVQSYVNSWCSYPKTWIFTTDSNLKIVVFTERVLEAVAKERALEKEDKNLLAKKEKNSEKQVLLREADM